MGRMIHVSLFSEIVKNCCQVNSAGYQYNNKYEKRFQRVRYLRIK